MRCGSAELKLLQLGNDSKATGLPPFGAFMYLSNMVCSVCFNQLKRFLVRVAVLGRSGMCMNNILLATIAFLPISFSMIACRSVAAQDVGIIDAPPLEAAVVRLRDVCRLKGQEENTLHGWGLVVGLKGTGDEAVAPTLRALARFTQQLGGSIAADGDGLPSVEELEASKNVAAVFITAKVPAAGAQQGDQLDCQVNAISAKSIVGGRLMLSYLVGPRADQPVVYAHAEGQLSVPDANIPTSATVYNGCKMESTITNQFVQDGKLTLILDKDFASFANAVLVQDAIEGESQAGLAGAVGAPNSDFGAKAEGQQYVTVSIPGTYKDQPVKFVSLLMDLRLSNIKKRKRVVINEREGVIVIGQDVLMNPVAVNHKNLTIEAVPGQGGFVGLDTQLGNQVRPKLKNLVDALNGLRVPTKDVINIIRTLKRKGDIYGEVIFY